MIDGSLSGYPVVLRLARNALLATVGVVVSVAALPAAAESSTQTAPETRPALEVTSVSATLEGWLGSEQPEPQAPEAPNGPKTPREPGAGREPIAPSDPERLPASWYFEYAPGTSCTGAGDETTTEHLAALKGFDAARATVTGLRPSTEYTVCLVDMSTVLPGVSFTTLAEASTPTATGELTVTGTPIVTGEPTVTQSNSESPLLPLPSEPAPGGASMTKGALKLTKTLKSCEQKPKETAGELREAGQKEARGASEVMEVDGKLRAPSLRRRRARPSLAASERG